MDNFSVPLWPGIPLDSIRLAVFNRGAMTQEIFSEATLPTVNPDWLIISRKPRRGVAFISSRPRFTR